MRDIITISIPTKTRLILKKRLTARGFQGVSEYMRYLIEQDEDVISQDKLLKMAARAKKEYANNKLKSFTSLSDIA